MTDELNQLRKRDDERRRTAYTAATVEASDDIRTLLDALADR